MSGADVKMTRNGRGWLLAPLLVAALLVTLAVARDSSQWAAVFAHPARTNANGGTIVESTQRGAALWRMMLPVAAGALIAGSLALAWLCQGATQRRAPAAMTSGQLRVLAGLVVLALLVRATRLGESLWYDELATLQQFIAFGPGVIVGNFFDPGNHIAHSLATWCAVSALGVNEVWMRLPALVFSFMAIPAMFGLAGRGTGSRRVALFAAALMAVIPVAVLEGVESRGYSMMMFFSIAATWTLLAAAEDDRPWQWVLYAALIALGAWSHMMTAFVCAGHAVWLTWRAGWTRNGGLALRGFLAMSLAGLLTFTLYSPVLFDMLASRGLYAARTGSEPSVFGPEGLHALLQLGGSWYPWASIAGLLLVMLGAAIGWRGAPTRGALAAAAIGMPLAVITILAAGSWMYARFLLFGLPAAVLAMALGIDALWKRSRMAGAAASAILIASFAGDLLIRPPKQPLRDAVAFVAEHRSAEQRVGTIGLALPVIDYCGAAFGLELHDSGLNGVELERLLREHEPSWFIVYYPRSVPPSRYALLAAEGFELTETFDGWVDWNNGDVLVYRKKE